MAVVETISLTIPTALFLGLAFGAGPCNLTCLPYLGPTFVASEGTANHAWRTVIPFSAGRLTGYSSLGLAAGFLGNDTCWSFLIVEKETKTSIRCKNFCKYSSNRFY